MTPETEKALRESIAHWERMRDQGVSSGEEPTGDYCALCQMFAETTGSCSGCPVNQATHICCANSPFFAAHKAWGLKGGDSPEFRTAAQAEIDFLKSLLPVCQTCGGMGSLSTTATDREGNHVEIGCPDCADPAPAGEA